ncbi:MAG: hypothetical protein IT165_17725 [Bryobacterales bacterium]|nr:hypothetical protein [Bryobacterales bacterium]
MVMVDNQTGGPVNVLPERFYIAIPGRKPKILAPRDPVKMIASIEWKARFYSALDEALSAMQRTATTTQSTYSGTYFGTGGFGSVSGTATHVTTAPDYQERRLAALRTLQRREAAREQADWIQSVALKANTLYPGETVCGWLWFDRDSALRKQESAYVLTFILDRYFLEF